MSKARVRYRAFDDARVAAIFEGFPSETRGQLLSLRELIFDTATAIEGVGALEETLRWGEPTYLTTESGSGSMIRLNQKRASNTSYAMYFHCQTDLVKRFRALFPRTFRFEGNRALVFSSDAALPVEQVRACVALALTYHRDRRRR